MTRVGTDTNIVIGCGPLVQWATSMSRLISSLLLAGLLACGAGPSAVALELLMFERAGCSWCRKFDAEIGRIYAATDEGRKAPLRRVDVDKPLPADLTHVDPGRFTPTFVLFDNGKELGRIRGYPGQDFFFGMLNAVLVDGARAAVVAAPEPRAN